MKSPKRKMGTRDYLPPTLMQDEDDWQKKNPPSVILTTKMIPKVKAMMEKLAQSATPPSNTSEAATSATTADGVSANDILKEES